MYKADFDASLKHISVKRANK